MYEKQKAQVEETQLKEAKLNEDLAKTDTDIQKNNDGIKTEEAKQEEIKKGESDVKKTNGVVDFLNSFYK